MNKHAIAICACALLDGLLVILQPTKVTIINFALCTACVDLVLISNSIIDRAMMG